MESFDSTKKGLYEILKDVHIGKIQLPDFQRGWVWDDNRIKGILASVAKSFPIGAIMLLETGNETVRFKTKPVEGVNLINGEKPEQLILDGQQRITSLYQAIITNKVVNTRNEKGYELKRWYYIDMRKAMDNSLDLEEAIISVNEKKQITSNIGRDIDLDLSTEVKEFENLMFPVCMIDHNDCIEWRMKYWDFYADDTEKLQFWNEFERKVILSFNNYMLPVILMKKENPKEAVCQVFEKVNTGGVSLTVFELLTATFATDEFDLKEDWSKIKQSFKEYKVLSGVSNTDIVQAITLLSTYYRKLEKMKSNTPKDDLPAVSCKRKDMLNLTLPEYLRFKEQVINGCIKASKILVENHIYSSRDLPYSTQLIPMSAILAVLGDKIESMGNKNKLMRWFWCGVFGELYGSANETRYALDLPQVVSWIESDGPAPKTVYEAGFSPNRLNTLRTRNSAAYKGIYALLLADETRDWLSATKIDLSTYFSESIDIHHIFPVSWCTKNKIPREDYDSIINKTPLSGRTNRIVSGDAPSKYLPRLLKHADVDIEEFNKYLTTHILNHSYLYADDFYGFFADRKELILQRIEKAMGKTISREFIENEGEYLENSDNSEL